MRKIILAALVLTLGLSSAAYADRDHRGRDRDRQFRGRGNQGLVVRDNRNWNRGQVRWVRGNDRVVVRHHHHHHRPRIVYANNGYYAFGPNIRYRYARPVIARRYFDIRYRPALIVENYAPVTGYIWVRGHWNWNGYEWMWVPGHYEIDQSYYNNGYNGSYDDYGTY